MEHFLLCYSIIGMGNGPYHFFSKKIQSTVPSLNVPQVDQMLVNRSRYIIQVFLTYDKTASRR